MKGIVIKKLADDFWVMCNNENKVYKCKSRGTLKSKGVFIGDNVEFFYDNGIYIITRIEKRKNFLIRPPVANIDQLIIVIAHIPKPDYMLVDKLLLFSYFYNIEPIILVNKQDVSDEENKYVEFTYSKFVKTIFASAKSGFNIELLKNTLKNKISAFAGQSAVGKSALINLIFKNQLANEGNLSVKLNRGKNTTRHSEIYCFDNIMIADTSGFTSLNEKLLDIPYYELPYYYPDYNEHKLDCKYSSCTHTKEPVKDCKIKQLVENKILDKNRHIRYDKIYETLQKKWVETHG